MVCSGALHGQRAVLRVRDTTQARVFNLNIDKKQGISKWL